MPVKVVDASALGAIAFGEPEGEAVAAMLSNSYWSPRCFCGSNCQTSALKKSGNSRIKKTGF
jgi:uncharacterized protein with PIN domain